MRYGSRMLTKEHPLFHYGGFLLDVDGVLVRGGRALPGAIQALATLSNHGKALLLTNNSTSSRTAAIGKLASLGLPMESTGLIPSSYVAAHYLLENHGPVAVWPVGEAGLAEELRLAGHRIVESPTDAAWVVAGMDREIDYRKLDQALQALLAGARLLATNRDPTYPAAGGFHPGAGAIIGALEGTGYPPDVVVGKPSPIPYSMAVRELGLPCGQLLMIGDRLDTDIAGASRAGIASALVLSGVTSEDELAGSALRPTWIARDLAALACGDVRPGSLREPPPKV